MGGGALGGEVRIFDAKSSHLLFTIPPPDDMEQSNQGLDTSTGAWAPDGSLFVGSSGTLLRQIDPVTFELQRSVVVPRIATGGTLQFSDDGTFVVGRGTVEHDDFSSESSMARIDLAAGNVVWTIDDQEFSRNGCDVFAFSVPEDRLWCADYTGVVRGRSLDTGELDGTTVEHQRSGLSSIAVQSVGGHRYLVAFGQQSAFVGRWQIDGRGTDHAQRLRRSRRCRIQP